MKIRSGFVSNSSTSSFVCTFIGVPTKKIIKKKKGNVLINGEVFTTEDEFAGDEEYTVDDFLSQKKIKLAVVGNSIGYMVASESDCLSYDVTGSTDKIGDLAAVTKTWEEAVAEFKKVGYEGPLKMYMYSEVSAG